MKSFIEIGVKTDGEILENRTHNRMIHPVFSFFTQNASGITGTVDAAKIPSHVRRFERLSSQHFDKLHQHVYHTMLPPGGLRNGSVEWIYNRRLDRHKNR